MDNQTFTIRFEGAGAEHHELDLRRLADSLIGIEQIINICLFSLLKGDFPKQSERLPLVVRASMPRRGSFEIEVTIVVIPMLFGLFREKFPGILGFIWKYIHKALLEMCGMEEGTGLNSRDLIEYMRVVESDRHTEIMELLESQRLLNAAQRTVSPIGPSCERIVILTDEGKVEFDTALAKAIRSGNQTYLGGIGEFRVRVVGLNNHNKRLRVSIDGNPDIISAQVRDPDFDKVPNIYTAAVTNQGLLNVGARARCLKGGRIKELLIFRARPVADRAE